MTQKMQICDFFVEKYRKFLYVKVFKKVYENFLQILRKKVEDLYVLAGTVGQPYIFLALSIIMCINCKQLWIMGLLFFFFFFFLICNFFLFIMVNLKIQIMLTYINATAYDNTTISLVKNLRKKNKLIN